MESLSASTNPIVVDLTNRVDGRTGVHYRMERDHELWHRVKGGPWTRVKDPTNLDGFEGNFPNLEGSLTRRLAPGEFYEIGIFSMDRGPLRDPDQLAYLLVAHRVRRLRPQRPLAVLRPNGRGPK
jgi:hypothetical protein